MRLAGLTELVGGIATGVSGVSLALYVLRPAASPSDYLGLFSVATCAALLVAVGTYAHTVSGNPWGRVPLWVGAVILIYQAASLLVRVPVGLYFEGWVGLFLLLPGLTAALALIASLFFRPRPEN
ncbi:MAG TPA: hypothetical protein VGX48_22760 [Pyrinomonadaceae bacterium]|jgi:hypothetical protein|nr:hypothetical protein [Pyrinomonadaceae bacterium]